MSEQMKDGGPAFPSTPSWSDGVCVGTHAPGMTLRDWFAGQAMAAMTPTNPDRSWDWDECSRQAYMAADAMLVTRVPADAMLAARDEGGAPHA